nr:hypothetical protein [Tanacetum cinerariifolium]
MDVEEDPKEEQDMDVEDVVPPVAAPPTVLSSITPPSLTLEVGGPSSVSAPHHTSWFMRVSDDVLTQQEDKAKDREEIRRLKRWLNAVEVSNTLLAMDQDRIERVLFSMRVWVSRFMSEVMGRGVLEARPSKSIDVLVVYGDAQHCEPQGPHDGPQRLRRKAVERLVANRVAEAITEYKRNRTNPKGEIAGGAGGNITPNVRGCSYKTFLNCKFHSLNGIKGVQGLNRCFKNMESVFEISKCAEEDKKMEQELWTLYMKEDDIYGYTNRFYELAVICPTLGTLEYIKIECYVWGLLKRIQGNVTSSMSANVHEAICVARELVDQSVRAKAIRISERNKRRCQLVIGWGMTRVEVLSDEDDVVSWMIVWFDGVVEMAWCGDGSC